MRNPSNSSGHTPWSLAIVLATALSLLVTGCSTTAETRTSDPLPAIRVDAGLADSVPAAYKADGVLTVATDPTYPPLEFTDAGVLRGVDIDLARAIGAVLGMRVEFTSVPYDTIVPSTAIGRFDLAIAAIWATDPESALANMVTYYQAGTSYAVRVGTHGPTSVGLGLCGHSVAVEEGTELVDSLVATSKKCQAANLARITIHACDNQALATAALLDGSVQAMAADSPVITYTLAQNPNALAPLGTVSNLRPYGIATPSADQQWAQTVRGAVQQLIDGGQYAEILARWNDSAGAISKSEVLPAHPGSSVLAPNSPSTGPTTVSD
ncbi:MAG: transporter substrate-binding domain-containing protein [Actinomycetes bacterium]